MVDRFVEQVQADRAQWQGWIERKLNDGKKVALWGGGVPDHARHHPEQVLPAMSPIADVAEIDAKLPFNRPPSIRESTMLHPHSLVAS